jgi:acetyltransferase
VGEDDPGMAEGAVVVIDAFQGRGLGSLLLDRLVRYARANGVTGFVATIHTSNAPMLGIVQRSQYPVVRKMLEPGVWQARINLERRLEPR